MRVGYVETREEQYHKGYGLSECGVVVKYIFVFLYNKTYYVPLS